MKLSWLAWCAVLLVLAGLSGQLQARGQGTPTPTSMLFNPNRPQTREPTRTTTATLRQIARTLTPTPEFVGAPFLDEAMAEVLFPVGVVFQLRVDAPTADIDTARFTVSAEDGRALASITVDLSTNASQGDDNSTRIFADYLFAPTDAPRLFSTLSYEWTVRLKANVTGTARSSITFQDVRLFDGKQPLFGWRQVSNEATQLHLLSHNPDLSLPVLQTRVGRALQRLRAETNSREVFRVMIYDPGYRFCTALEGFSKLFALSRTTSRYLDCREEDAVALYQQQGYLVVERTDLSLDRLEMQLVDGLARRMYSTLWGERPIPLWFSEGLFRLYAPRDQRTALTLARSASREQRLLRLSALQQPVTTVSDGRLWTAQSYLLVLYIASRYGATAPLDIARKIGDSDGFEAALQAVSATDEQRLYAGWEQWLLTPRAESDTNWTIYAGLTPQPTETARAQPSITPTSSEPTASRTPTETQPPLASITPRPTRTPLPPGSLRSPTPAQTPGTAAPQATSISTGALLVGGGLIALLLVVAILAALRSGSATRSQ
jgi:hypothetical protein